MSKWKFLRIWFPVAFYSGIIFYASSVPNLKPPLDWPQADKLCHFSEYGPFGFLLARAVRHTGVDFSTRKILWFVLLGAMFYSLTDEFHQAFVAGRTSSVADAMFDVVGSMLGGWLYANYKTV